jgi:hypothetical protein
MREELRVYTPVRNQGLGAGDVVFLGGLEEDLGG